MKYSELPPAYKKLADKYDGDNDRITHRFLWLNTDEGEDFWWDVDSAQSEDKLPPLPDGIYPQEDGSTHIVAKDFQVGGDHYTKLKIQPLEIILANDLNFLEGNVVKYVLRYRNKGLDKDIDKAIDCLQKLKKHEYPDK